MATTNVITTLQKKCIHAFVLFFITANLPANAQQLSIRDFVLFGGDSTCPTGTNQQAPLFPGCGVNIGSSTSIQQGSVGSYRLVTSTGNSTINANIYSGGTVQLANSNVVTGKITAANRGNVSGNVVTIGSSLSLGGNLDAKGNISIGGGTVAGRVTHPSGTTYSGPTPAGGDIIGTPVFPTLPLMPAINVIPSIPVAAENISNNKTVVPDILYGNLTLTGNKTITFNGSGNYVFRSIKNSGTTNKFIFDFGPNNPDGIIRVFVEGDVDLNKVLASIRGDGSASRIFLETHGRGLTSSTGTTAFNIANGSAGSTTKWLGAVWAPFGAITVGAGTGSSDLSGALWSGTQVNILSGVVVTYAPPVEDNIIVPFNPSTPFKNRTLLGAVLTSLTKNITEEARKLLVIQDGYVLINVIAKVTHEADVLQMLTDSGMIGFVSNGANTLITTGRYPIAKLLGLLNRGDIINFCEPVFAPIGHTGLIQNAGDTAVGGFLVRNGFNLQGEGVKIGVLSDSYNSLKTVTNDPAAADISSGDLPGIGNPNYPTPVEILLEYPYSARSDEGRAMLQIIHDIAPKASLAFRTGFISQGDLAEGVKAMKAAGCGVIVDDITFINEPFLQDGPVAKAIDLVKSQGVSYFTSAGNFGNKSYQATYNPTTAPAGFLPGTTAHNFGGGDIYQKIKLKPGSYTIALQWVDDIYSLGQTSNGGTLNDFDFYITDQNFQLICGYDVVNTGGDPFEFLAFTVNNSVAEIEANILITRENNGTATALFKYVIFRGDAVIAEYPAGQSTIIGHANANGAIAVGAVNYWKTPAFNVATPVTAPYSSIGGTLIAGENRNKPDISAPDGVNTSVNMGPDQAIDADPFSNFFGTSAAAPQAAAVAALLIEGRKKYKQENVSPDGVKALMQNSAIPFGTANAAGAGLLQADSAMRTFASPKPVITSLSFPSTITPENSSGTFTLSVNGEYLTSKSTIYVRDIPVNTTFVSNKLLTTTITNLVGNPPIKICTQPIAVGDGGCSDALLFFDIPKKTIKITADNKTKKYGELLPAFTSVVTVFNPATSTTVPLSQSGLSLTDVGLQNLSYSSNANSLSNVGNQYFIKPVRTFNPLNTADVALLEKYIYDTVPGILTIQKLPVQVIPQNKDLTYGDPIGEITFAYQIDPTIAATNPAVLEIIGLSHEALLNTDVLGLVNSQPVAISNGQPIALSNGQPIALSNGQPVALSNGQYVPIANAQSVTGFETGIATIVPYQLTNAQLSQLSFFVSNKSLLNARTLASSTKVVDFAQEAILGYNVNPALTKMVSIIPQVNARGLLGADQLTNGQPVALSNGQPVALSNSQPVALSNGQPVALSNGQPIALSNGQPIALSNSFSQQAAKIPVIIDQNDVSTPATNGIIINSLNLITGITSGVHKIIPGSLLNDNFEITYGLGTLRIYPAALTVKANNTSREYGEPNPTFTASYTGLKYGENFETSDLEGVPSFTTTAVVASPAGTYPIETKVGSLTSGNYTFNFANGTLTVTDACLLTRAPFNNFGSTPSPQKPTSLWLSITVKISGQLKKLGDSLVFSGGSIIFNDIIDPITNAAIPTAFIPRGKIKVDNVPAPISRYESGAWITLIPMNFASTSDIFITGAIINSANGFVKKKNNANSNTVVKGHFYSNSFYSDQWTYALATYRPTFDYSAIAGSSGTGKVVAINGSYRAGTPLSSSNTPINSLVNGGSGGGGNNYTGSTSSYDNFTACCIGSTSACVPGTSLTANKTIDLVTDGQEDFKTTPEDFDGDEFSVTPNPASSYISVTFFATYKGVHKVLLYNIDGRKVFETAGDIYEAGKKYTKQIDVNKMTSGLYLVQVRSKNKATMKKVIISR